MTSLDKNYFDTYANYEIGYDLLSQNVANASSLVRFYGVLNVTGNNIDFGSYLQAGVWSASANANTYYTNGSYTLVTTDVTLYHDKDGNFSGTATGWLQSSYKNAYGLSGNFTLPNIPRSSTPTINKEKDNQPEFNIGDTITIYTNRYSDNFTHKIYINFGSTRSLVASDVGASYSFDTSTIANNLYATIPNSNILKGTIELETYNGSNKVGDTKSCNYVAKVVNANPTFSNFAYKDSNSTTIALTGNNQSIITGYSDIKITISTSNKAVAQKSATMKKYRIVIGNQNKEVNYSSSASVTATISKATTGVMNVYAIDSRGNSTLVTKTATNIIAYKSLARTKIPSSERKTGAGEEYTLNYEGTWWYGNFGEGFNQVTADYKYKRTTTSTWTTGTTNIEPNIALVGEHDGSFFYSKLIKGDTDAGFNINYSYNIIVTVKDALSEVTFEALIPSGKPNVAISQNGVALGQKYDENLGGTLQVNGTIYYIDNNGNSSNIMSLINSIKGVTESGTGYVKLDDGTMICYGEESGTGTLVDFWSILERISKTGIQFPKAFISAPKMSLTSKGNSSISIVLDDSTTTSFDITVFKPKGTNNSNYNFEYTAIGKWK